MWIPNFIRTHLTRKAGKDYALAKQLHERDDFPSAVDILQHAANLLRRADNEGPLRGDVENLLNEDCRKMATGLVEAGHSGQAVEILSSVVHQTTRGSLPTALLLADVLIRTGQQPAARDLLRRQIGDCGLAEVVRAALDKDETLVESEVIAGMIRGGHPGIDQDAPPLDALKNYLRKLDEEARQQREARERKRPEHRDEGMLSSPSPPYRW